MGWVQFLGSEPAALWPYPRHSARGSPGRHLYPVGHALRAGRACRHCTPDPLRRTYPLGSRAYPQSRPKIRGPPRGTHHIRVWPGVRSRRPTRRAWLIRAPYSEERVRATCLVLLDLGFSGKVQHNEKVLVQVESDSRWEHGGLALERPRTSGYSLPRVVAFCCAPWRIRLLTRDHEGIVFRSRRRSAKATPGQC
jgi:hypothetical protein